ncbi:hypothetical protein DIPPA_03751 [Diplonema papillatum]|nr:hypothetical protein DIPPA_03751 [Diplonema papillatum]
MHDHLPSAETSGAVEPPAKIRLHPQFQAMLKMDAAKVFVAWVVTVLTRKRQRQERLLVISEQLLLLVLLKDNLLQGRKAEDVTRVIDTKDIVSLTTRCLQPMDTADGVPCPFEAFLTSRTPGEPGLHFRVRQDPRNSPASPDPQYLEKVLKYILLVNGDSLRCTVKDPCPPNCIDICDPSQLRKGKDYMSPKKKQEGWKKNPHTSPTRSPARVQRSAFETVGGGAPYGAAPVGSAPYGAAPVGSAPYGAAPVGSAPYGAAPVGGAPYGAVPTGGPQAAAGGENPPQAGPGSNHRAPGAPYAQGGVADPHRGSHRGDDFGRSPGDGLASPRPMDSGLPGQPAAFGARNSRPVLAPLVPHDSKPGAARPYQSPQDVTYPAHDLPSPLAPEHNPWRAPDTTSPGVHRPVAKHVGPHTDFFADDLPTAGRDASAEKPAAQRSRWNTNNHAVTITVQTIS